MKPRLHSEWRVSMKDLALYRKDVVAFAEVMKHAEKSWSPKKALAAVSFFTEDTDYDSLDEVSTLLGPKLLTPLTIAIDGEGGKAASVAFGPAGTVDIHVRGAGQGDLVTALKRICAGGSTAIRAKERGYLHVAAVASLLVGTFVLHPFFVFAILPVLILFPKVATGVYFVPEEEVSTPWRRHGKEVMLVLLGVAGTWAAEHWAEIWARLSA